MKFNTNKTYFESTSRMLNNTLEKAQSLAINEIYQPHTTESDSVEKLLSRLGMMKNQDSTWKKVRQPKWRLRLVDKNEFNHWIQLFESSFNHQISFDFWKWKYQNISYIGLGAYSDNQLIAFYGGMPRKILYKGQNALAVQIGDVMVAPEHRGWLTKSGPFQMLAATYLENYIGDNRPYLLGYGFPSSTVMRLAERLKLYTAVDRLVELSWTSTKCRVWGYSSRPLEIDDLSLVSSLWDQMSSEFKESIIGYRDAEYLLERYINHPNIAYTILLIYDIFFRTPAGVVVLHDRHADGIELVDIVGPRIHWIKCIDIARKYASKTFRHRVFCWITASHAKWLSSKATQHTPLDIHIPTNIWSSGPSFESVKDKWFLMSGDADFR